MKHETGRERLARRLSLLRLILDHPLNRGHQLRAVGRMVAWQLWRALVRRPVTTHFWGELSVRVYPDWPYSWTAIYLGLPEYDDMMFTMRYLRAGDVLVDVGANIGFYSLIASSVNGGAPVVAIEPHPVASQRLRENASINAFRNIRIRPVAAGASASTAQLTSDLVDENHIAARDEDVPTVGVPVVTLDSELRRLGIDPRNVGLVKVDTEGFEARVLEGARGLLDETPGAVWLIEMTGLGERYGNRDEQVREVFAARGYSPYRYLETENRIVPYPGGEQGGGNVIFARSAALVSERLTSAEVRDRGAAA
jgi:FkbM family methyltransferase